MSTNPETTGSVRPEDVPAGLVKKAAEVLRFNQFPGQLPKNVRAALAAVIPEIQAQELRDEAATWSTEEDLEKWSEAEIHDAILINAARLTEGGQP